MKKGTKRLLIILLFVVGLSYFLFTTLVFDPFEGSYMDRFETPPAVAIEYAVPKSVDFFIHKRGLEKDFEDGDFPVPDAWRGITLAKSWQQFERTPFYRDFVAEHDPAAHVEELRARMEQVPVLSVLTDVAGRDLAIFGRIAGEEVPKTEYAAVFLGSQLARFAYEITGSPVLRSLFGIPFDVEEHESGVRILRMEGMEPIHVFRDLDLFAVGTSLGLVGAVADQIRGDRNQSLGYKRRYFNTVSREKNEFAGAFQRVDEGPVDLSNRVQASFDLETLLGFTGADESFLEYRGQLSRWLRAKLFDPRYYDELALDVAFGDVIDLRGILGFNRDLAEAADVGFYQNKTFELRPAMDRVAALLPEDTYLVMAVRVDMDRFLPKVVTGLTEVNPKGRELLDDVIQSIRRARSDFRPTNAIDAARQIAGFLGDDVVVALKRDTYYGPPDRPTPLVVVFFEVTDLGPSIEALEKRPSTSTAEMNGYHGFIFPVMRASKQLRTETSNVANWFNVTYHGGTPNERWIQDVIISGGDLKNVSFGIIDPKSKTKGPWTFALTLSAHTEVFEVERNGSLSEEQFGTAGELISDIIDLSIQQGGPTKRLDRLTGGQRDLRSLLHSPGYTRGQDFLEGFASLAAYFDAAGFKQVLLDEAHQYAEEKLLSPERWREITEEVEAELYAGPFAAWKGRSMPPDVADQFQASVDARKEEIEDEIRFTKLPQVKLEYEQSLAWVDLLVDAFLAAKVEEDSQNMEVRARVRTTLR